MLVHAGLYARVLTRACALRDCAACDRARCDSRRHALLDGGLLGRDEVGKARVALRLARRKLLQRCGNGGEGVSSLSAIL